MRYTEAKTEFQIRLYQWAKVAQEREMAESFPNFKYCKQESVGRTLLFFRGLDSHSRAVIARGMLQQSHREAVQVLGESVSIEALDLMRREEAFRQRWSPGTWEGMYAPKNNESKPVSATRRQVKRAITDRFRAEFGEQCIPPDPQAGKIDFEFWIKCRGWVVKTQYMFGKWGLEVSQEHDVWSGKWITKDAPAVLLANCIGFRLCYGNAIGIGSGWDNISVENIDPVCIEIIAHCRQMFDAFPKLLEGLDLELMTT